MRAKFVSVRTFGLALLMVVAAISQLSACSVVGAGIGASISASGTSSRTIPSLEVENVKPGTQITIITKQGSRISGKYAGIEHVPTEGYAESYTKSREQNREEVILPALDDSITIKQIYGFLVYKKKVKGEFLGFDSETIWVKRMGRTNPNKVNLDTVLNIVDSDGNVVQAETLRKLMSEGKIPPLSVLSAIYVQSEGGKTRFAIDRVHEIQVLVNGKSHALTGFLIGAAVDALVALWYFRESLISDKCILFICLGN